MSNNFKLCHLHIFGISIITLQCWYSVPQLYNNNVLSTSVAIFIRRLFKILHIRHRNEARNKSNLNSPRCHILSGDIRLLVLLSLQFKDWVTTPSKTKGTVLPIFSLDVQCFVTQICLQKLHFRHFSLLVLALHYHMQGWFLNNVVQSSFYLLPYLKIIPVTGRRCPYDCETLRLPQILDNRLTDGVEVISLTRRSYFTPRKILGPHFY
jgi:hypothetical protein